jgi:hypothetical protein
MTSETESQIHHCECDICKAGADLEIARHHRQMNVFLSRLNEPQRRWYVGLLSQRPDSPSDRQLAKITGLDEKTIQRGRQELEAELAGLPPDRQRREGGGRPRAEKKTQS